MCLTRQSNYGNVFVMYVAMKHEIDILKKHLGTDKAVGRVLGISLRHVQNIKSGYKVSKHLRNLIRVLVYLLDAE